MFHNQAGLRFSVFLIKRKDIFGFDKNDTRKKLEENIHTKPPFISEKKTKRICRFVALKTAADHNKEMKPQPVWEMHATRNLAQRSHRQHSS